MCAHVFSIGFLPTTNLRKFFFFVFLKGHGGRLKDESDVLPFLFRILHCDLAYALWRFLFLFLFFFFFNVFLSSSFFFWRKGGVGVQWVMPTRVILLAGRRSWFGKHSSAV